MTILARFIVAAAVAFPVSGALLLAATIGIGSGLERDAGTAFVMLMVFFVNPFLAIAAAASAGVWAASRNWNPYPWLALLLIAGCVYWATKRGPEVVDIFVSPVPMIPEETSRE